MPATYRQKVLWMTPLMGGTVSRGMDSEESQFKRTLGGQILAMRVDAGIRSQGALAAKLVKTGVESLSEATVRRWEKGTHAPDAWEINRLCALFGVEPDVLIHPEPMTERERALTRRAARQVHRTIDRERGVS